LKEYTLKFGLHYKINTWHVCKSYNKYKQYLADCNSNIFMGHIETEPKYYIHPIKKSLWSEIEINLNKNINLNYKNICKKCKKKFQLTEEDINHYIVLAKFGIKI